MLLADDVTEADILSPPISEISSDRVTDWGDWGTWDECPSGQFVIGMMVKSEKKQGFSGDDTGLNGIRLFCSPMGLNFRRKDVESSVGDWGTWGKEMYCKDGHKAVGFELRSEVW